MTHPELKPEDIAAVTAVGKGFGDKIWGSLAAVGTSASFLLGGGLCQTANWYYILPWVVVGFVIGVLVTTLVVFCCAAFAGGQYWVLNQRRGRRRTKSRRVSSPSPQGSSSDEGPSPGARRRSAVVAVEDWGDLPAEKPGPKTKKR
jgi:hypothetical protein